jgi:hypothetical protein
MMQLAKIAAILLCTALLAGATRAGEQEADQWLPAAAIDREWTGNRIGKRRRRNVTPQVRARDE